MTHTQVKSPRTLRTWFDFVNMTSLSNYHTDNDSYSQRDFSKRLCKCQRDLSLCQRDLSKRLCKYESWLLAKCVDFSLECESWLIFTSLTKGLFKETRLVSHTCKVKSCWQSAVMFTKCMDGEVGGWGRVPFSRNLMSPTPRCKWYLSTGRRAH